MQRNPEILQSPLYAESHRSPENGPESLPISQEFLQSLYGSPAFIEKLKATMGLVQKFKGREFGFVVDKDRDSDQVFLGMPAGGESEDEVDMGFQHKEMRSQLEKVLRVRSYLKAKGTDGSLSPLKHPRKRLSNPYRTHASDLGRNRVRQLNSPSVREFHLRGR